jgi:hypothetical protein
MTQRQFESCEKLNRDSGNYFCRGRARGYAEVKKELKGRYPKHYWPDDPTTAVATARARPRQK